MVLIVDVCMCRPTERLLLAAPGLMKGGKALLTKRQHTIMCRHSPSKTTYLPPRLPLRVSGTSLHPEVFSCVHTPLVVVDCHLKEFYMAWISSLCGYDFCN